MAIITVLHRHRYVFPVGYTCTVERYRLADLIGALLPNSCPHIFLVLDDHEWELMFSTPPVESMDLIVIGDKLDSLVSQHRKAADSTPPQA